MKRQHGREGRCGGEVAGGAKRSGLEVGVAKPHVMLVQKKEVTLTQFLMWLKLAGAC